MHLAKYFIIICVAFILGGCVTTELGVFDSSVPESEQCRLEIHGSVSIFEFDGEPVVWQVRSRAVGFKSVIMIPAGEHTLVGLYNTFISNANSTVILRADGLQITYNFKPGAEYWLSTESNGNRMWLNIEEDD